MNENVLQTLPMKNNGPTLAIQTPSLTNHPIFAAEIPRGAYNQIPLNYLLADTAKEVEQLVAEAGQANKVDEHGSWEWQKPWIWSASTILFTQHSKQRSRLG